MSDLRPGLTGAEVRSGKHGAWTLRPTTLADLICRPHKKKKKICLSGKYAELWSRRRRTHKFVSCPAVRSAVLVVARQPRMTPAVAAVQLGYSTDREALSDTTIAPTRHNADALAEGAAGMPLPRVEAAGTEGWSDARTDGGRVIWFGEITGE